MLGLCVAWLAPLPSLAQSTSSVEPRAGQSGPAPARVRASEFVDPQVSNDPTPASKDERERREPRVLDGHTFPVAAFVPTAFTVSTFGVRAGIENRTVPGFASGLFLGEGKQGTRTNLETVSANEALDLTVRLHRFIALGVDGYGRARVGANAPALLGTGADYEYGANASALLRLLRFPLFQLSLRARGGYMAGQSAGFSHLFQDLFDLARATATRVLEDQGDLPSELTKLDAGFSAIARSLLTQFHGGRWGLSLHGALAVTRYLGLQGAVGFGWERMVYEATRYDAEEALSKYWSSQTTTLRMLAAVAVDLDLEPIGFPLDIVLEYAPERSSRNGFVTSNSVLEQRIAAGLYYSGRSDLQLGVTGYFLFGQFPEIGANTAASGRPRDVGAQFVFRYVW